MDPCISNMGDDGDDIAKEIDRGVWVVVVAAGVLDRLLRPRSEVEALRSKDVAVADSLSIAPGDCLPPVAANLRCLEGVPKDLGMRSPQTRGEVSIFSLVVLTSNWRRLVRFIGDESDLRCTGVTFS